MAAAPRKWRGSPTKHNRLAACSETDAIYLTYRGIRPTPQLPWLFCRVRHLAWIEFLGPCAIRDRPRPARVGQFIVEPLLLRDPGF